MNSQQFNEVVQARTILNSLTILIQGPVATENIQAMLSAISFYRTEFPGAGIVLSISPTTRQADRQLADIAHELSQVVDAVTVAQRHTALPPIKHGIGSNHFNQQLASAQAGLKLVTTEYTLRIRSDMLSVRCAILEHYAKNAGLPRGGYAVLQQRVLISPYFTLNPFTTEKLSFHYSDWLHLGLTQDLIRIWSVAPYSAVDADFYPYNASIAPALEEADKFRSRLAVEQHIYFNLLAPAPSDLQLTRHTDHRRAQPSLHALADNFIIDDVHKSRAIPNKYENLLVDKILEITCLTYDDWRDIAWSRPSDDLRKSFEGKIAIAKMQRRRARAGSAKATSPAAEFAIKIIIFIARLFSGEKSKRKLAESPGLFFYDIKKQPSKTLASLYFKLSRLPHNHTRS